jgi:hypothetical protein
MSDEIIRYAKKNKEGFTAFYKDGKLYPVKGNQKERYSVADKTAIIYTPKEKNVRYYSPVLDKTYVGGWYDKSTGKYLIENINLYSSRQKALDVARKRKQKAIFDLVKMNEITLTYRERVTGIRIKTRKRDVVIRKKGKYFNRITGKYVSLNTAKRLNSFFRKHPNATMYEASGRPVYDKDKPWIEQSDRLHNMFKKKKTQVIKSKTKSGKEVYFNPLLGKQVPKSHVKKAMKYDYQDGQFYVQLYRMTATKDRVYHIITTNIFRTIEEHEDIDRLFDRLVKTWMHDAKKITSSIHYKYPLSKSDVMYISFDHDILVTNYGQKDNGAFIVMKNRSPNARGMSDFQEQMNNTRLKYHALLISYRLIMIKKVRIFIYSFANEGNRALSELRLGVYNRNGN